MQSNNPFTKWTGMNFFKKKVHSCDWDQIANRDCSIAALFIQIKWPKANIPNKPSPYHASNMLWCPCRRIPRNRDDVSWQIPYLSFWLIFVSFLLSKKWMSDNVEQSVGECRQISAKNVKCLYKIWFKWGKMQCE